MAILCLAHYCVLLMVEHLYAHSNDLVTVAHQVLLYLFVHTVIHSICMVMQHN